MTAAALIRESLGRVTPMARQVTVDAAVDGFQRRLAGWELFPPVHPVHGPRQVYETLLWGRAALDRAQSAIGYGEVARDLARVLHKLTAEVLETYGG